MGKFFSDPETSVYGWLKDTGDFQRVEATGHYQGMPEKWRSGSLDYSPAYNAGWVRVTSYYSHALNCMFMEVYGTEDALESLEGKIVDLAYAMEAKTTHWYTVDARGQVIKQQT